MSRWTYINDMTQKIGHHLCMIPNSTNILIIDQQRQAAKDQMRTLQEKQSLSLQHQQSQCQMLMKQLQSQMESEMLMKSELVRNQMQMLAQNGGDLSGEL